MTKDQEELLRRIIYFANASSSKATNVHELYNALVTEVKKFHKDTLNPNISRLIGDFSDNLADKLVDKLAKAERKYEYLR